MTPIFVPCTLFGAWLYLYLVRDLARAERSGVIHRLREGDRQNYIRKVVIKASGASLALVLTALSLVATFA